MKKWTTTGPNTCGVSLQQILDSRSGPLNEVECWALIGQLCITLQQNICNYNVKTLPSSSVVHLPNFVVTPRTVRCTRVGHILLLPYPSTVQPGFENIHLEYTKLNNAESLKEDFENQLTSLGILSIAKTALFCLSSNINKNQREEYQNSSDSTALSNFLLNILQNYENVSIKEVQDTVTSSWAEIVGKTPTSQFISQLCKVTMGWTSSIARQNRIYSSISLRRDFSRVASEDTHLKSNQLSQHRSESDTFLSQVNNQSASIKFLDDLMNEEGTNEKSITPLCTSSPTKNKNLPASSLPDLSNNNIYVDLNSATHAQLNSQKLYKQESANIVTDQKKECEETVINENQPKETIDAPKIRQKGQYGRRLDYKPSGCVSRSIGGTQKTVTTMHQFYNSMLSSSSSTTSNSHNEQFSTPSGAKTIQTQIVQRLPSVTFKQTQLNKETSLKMVASKLSEESDDGNERGSKKRKCVQRNPSRLYRVVKPLTEVTSIPSPATKRCVGPEFIVMSSELEALRLDLCIRSTRRDATMVVAKEIEIIMINGQKFVAQVNPTNITAGEVLESILREQDIKESAMFAVAALQDGEYMPLANDVKLSKVAPLGWKDSNTVASRSLRSGNGNNPLFRQEKVFTLFLRFKFWPGDIDEHLKDSKNKHQLYLQMRRDLLENRYRMSVTEHFTLAGMALQIEFGDFSEDIHGGSDSYFMLEHYLPQHIVYEIGKTQSKQCLQKVHRAHVGQSQSKTELKFCRQIQQLSVYGFHLFNVGMDKASSRRASSEFLLSERCTSKKSIVIGIHIEGIFIFEVGSNKDLSLPHKMTSSYFWHKVERIEYDKTRFQLHVQGNADGNHQSENKTNDKNVKKLKYYVPENKAKFLFDLSSAHHQYSNRQKLRDNQRVEIADPTPTTVIRDSVTDQNNFLSQSTDVQYKEPQRSMRSLKSRFFLSRRNISQRKLYTNGSSATRPRARSQSRDRDSLSNRCRRLSGRLISNSTSSPSINDKQLLKSSTAVSEQSNGYMVKRLAHYTSMADALINPKTTPITSRYQQNENDFNVSDKENTTPNSKYRYKFYLEPEEDEHVQKCHILTDKEQIKPSSKNRIPLQERPIEAVSGQFSHMNKIATSVTQKVVSQRSDAVTKNSKKTNRKSNGGGLTSNNGNRLRMGTRLSLSALHRDRLRLTSEIGSLLPTVSMPRSSANVFSTKPMSDFEDVTMETKSLFDKNDRKISYMDYSQPKDKFPTAYVIHTSVNDSQLDIDSAEAFPYSSEEIDESLNERFNAMETDGPERKIVSVKLSKDEHGRLGLKITGTPDGIYVEDFDTQSLHGGKDHTERKKLKNGDRILAINGRDLTNVSYHNALDLIKRSGKTVEFVVSQINNS